ncbi:hypothetical protein HHK36_015599 [Tetracentron sinense]|uniref:Bacterial Ig-like domain-containing protein n=1 Tax=Tetracentron sinense TaxID=13715 RepID=A0A834Z7J3_TETSI|nr:hypothetical protein HHK36_015599 [Tetracentron sinense]
MSETVFSSSIPIKSFKPGYSEMGLNRFSWLLLFSCVFLLLCLKAHCDGSDVSVNFLKAPRLFSPLTSATFVFEVLEGRNGDTCRNCTIKCKLDGGISSDCEARKVSYMGLQEGDHIFEVCINGSRGVGCASYNWTVDIVPPTAYITAATTFTNALNVSVDISFSEPCTGGGAFGCSSVNACNLLVYGAGQVVPSTLKVLQPNLKFSLLVSLSSSAQYGRVILVMDKSFCTDKAGNKFTRTTNSSFVVHFDRRSVFVNLRTHIPEKLLQLNSETRTVEATNNYENLKVYLYFSEPILNKSAEILSSLHSSQGLLLPANGKTRGNRRFGFLVINISSTAVVTISLDTSFIMSRQGTSVSPIAPVTFLYDSQRPAVRLSTTSKMRTREHTVPVLINFREISRSIYTVDILANSNLVSVNVPENITGDVAGNTNLASNILQVRHYSVPMVSSVLSTFATATFAATSLAAMLLTVSTASLQSAGACSRSSSSLTSHPARNLFRIACHIQVFALSRWLTDSMPVEYYEFARGLQWSIPYLSLPWETGHVQSVMVNSSPPIMTHSGISKNHDSKTFTSIQSGNAKLDMAASIFGLPLTPMEYKSYFESQNIKPEAEYILDPHNSNGWKEFNKNMFWLAVIGGSLMLLHALVLSTLKLRMKNSERHRYGALVLPRFEIFLIILALPCICQASEALIKGGDTSGVIVGILLLGVVSFLLLGLLSFLSIGITLGKLLQYKEVHQEGQKFHWYQEIVRVTLGPGKRGQWAWKDEPNSAHLTMLGPLFEDLRGPPKYMLSQISGGNLGKHGDRIIASDDETEDAEAPFIQKLFGILRIYYTLLESVKRVALGIVAGAYSINWSSRTPALILLCITSFQLFFLVLKKPFIKKKVQLVEIVSVASEVGIFATCLVLLESEFSAGDGTKIGIFMLLLFLIGFSTQLINEWYALYRQIIRLCSAENSFLSGLKIASFGFLLIFIPWNLLKNLYKQFPLNNSEDGEIGGTTSSGDRNRSSGSRSSGTTDKPWLKQLRELAKASFSKEEDGAPKDPSTSQANTSFWSGKRSGSSSVTSSADFKSKPRGLYRDLEAIFSSK